MEGTFDEATWRAYDDRTGVRFTRASVVYYLPGFSNPQSACLQRGTTPSPLQCLTQTYAPRLRSSILYLDCGRWGGDGGGITNWPRCRDFGVVFGRAAAICGYGVRQGPPEDNAGHETATPGEIAKSTDCQTIVDFVGQLATSRMGPAQIRQLLDCPLRSEAQVVEQGTPRRDRIYVFLGDLHLPAVDEGNQGDLLQEPATHGRLVGATADDGLLASMTIAERIDWFNRYHGSPTDLGADVFQHARMDLEEWLQVLIRYQGSSSGARLPIHFIQTGDMFDFWIGLHRYFGSSASGQVVLESAAEDFVSIWLNQTVNLTEQGRAAQAIQNASNTLNATYVYGNHDNYLARLPTRTGAGGVGRRVANFTDRDSGSRRGLLYAEHGHRMDGSNRDGSTAGHTATQAAFFFPQVRNFEDVARKGEALFSGAAPERITYFGDCADLCLSNGCAVFVMGHTHHGLVKRIDIVGPPR